MIIIGTSYFLSIPAAIRYFSYENTTRTTINKKIAEGLIHIGQPLVRKNQKLKIIDDGTRYTIVED